MTSTATVVQSAKKAKAIPHSPSDYSLRSPIRQAYSAHQIPITHLRLLNAIKKTLGGSDSGEIRLRDVLIAGGFHQNSGRALLTHLQNFGIIKVEPITADMRVTILKDPETFRATVQDEDTEEEDVEESSIADNHAEVEAEQDSQEVTAYEPFRKETQDFTPVHAPDPVKEESKPSPFNDDRALTPLEVLRKEVELLIGSDGLDLNEEEREDYFYDLTGKRDIRQIPADGLKLVIKDAKSELDKRDGI